jgi:hypothetical protein
MNKLFLSLLALAVGSADAMHIDPSGLGQVLIAPYYTVNGGNQTLISIANRSDRGKALKVRFLEAMNGREVFDFNLYLAPHDLWTGALFSQNADAPATLITNDDSCTVPALKTSTSLPQLSNGRRVAQFSDRQYVGDRNDAGPDDVRRTRDGYFEVIEMGEVINNAQSSLNDISAASDGIPANCLRIESAWAAGGYWAQNPGIDLTPPGGGVTATVTIVAALQGSMYAYQAQAIDGFSSIVQHTVPGSALPNLTSGVTSQSQGVVEAIVETESGLVTARYPLARAIDAVSALLMAETIDNEFVTNDSSRAASVWVVTLPTKKFYADDALVQGSAIAPFSRKFSQSAPPLSQGETGGERIVPVPVRAEFTQRRARGEAIQVDLWDREHRFAIDCLEELDPGNQQFCICPACSPPPPITIVGVPSIHWASNLLVFNVEDCAGPLADADSRICQHVDATALNSGFGENYTTFIDGWMRLQLYEPQGVDSLPNHLLRADESGHRFAGLPTIGFWAVSFTNGELMQGVLANYASLRMHRVTRRDVPTP